MRIYIKLLLYIITSSVIMTLLVVGAIGYINNQRAENDAIHIVDLEADKFAKLIKVEIDEAYSLAKSLSAIALGYDQLTVKKRNTFYRDLVESSLIQGANLNAISIIWELNAIDDTYLSPYGRLMSGYYRSAGRIKYRSKTMDLEGDNLKSDYYDMKSSLKPIWLPPKIQEYAPGDVPRMVSTIGMPIVENNKFIGATELDFKVSRFIDLAQQVRPFERVHTFLIATNWTIISDARDSLSNQNISKVFDKETVDYNLTERLQRGDRFSFMSEKNGEAYYNVFAPVYLGNTDLFWFVGMTVPLAEVKQGAILSILITTLLTIVGVVFLAVVLWIITRKITRPLREITALMHDISIGKLPEMHYNTQGKKDEFSIIYRSLAGLRHNLELKSDFAKAISIGDYNTEFKLSSENDFLGRSLLELRANLQRADSEAAERRKLEMQINWASKGFNAYNDIVSHNQQNFEHFTKEVIVWLTKFSEMAIGGLYLVEGSKKEYIRIYASHNYNRENKKRRKIPVGEGLIGRCVEENETMYVTDLPADYIKIASGLGEATAQYLLLVPLRLNNQAFGLLELASFKPIAEYRIEFVEKIGENIAATVMNMRSTSQAEKVLRDQSENAEYGKVKIQQLNERLEKLEQDKIKLQQGLEQQSNVGMAYFQNLPALEIRFDGQIVRCNDRFELLLGFTNDDLEKHNLTDLLVSEKDFVLSAWVEHVLAKKNLRRTIELTSRGEITKTLISYWGLLNLEEEKLLIIYFADISEFKMLTDESGRALAQVKEENVLLRNKINQLEEQMRHTHEENDEGSDPEANSI